MNRRQWRDRDDIDPIRPVPDWRQRQAPAWFVALLLGSIVVACGVLIGWIFTL